MASKRVKLAEEIDASPDDAAVFIGWFNASAEASDPARAASLRDVRYYNNKQLTDDEIKAYKKRGQPDVTNNLVRRKVDYILGAERQTRTDPKAFPRTRMEEGSAEAATDALRYVADKGRFAQVKSKATKDLLIPGYGGCYVGIEEKAGKFNVTFPFVPWDRIFFDPHSSEPDFSDARYLGFVTWYDQEEALRKYPGSEDVIATGAAEEFRNSFGEDKPKWLAWTDSKRKRVRTAEIYYRKDNIWHYACFTRGGLLKQPMPVTYLDENGEPECPLILVSAYVDEENNRHGIVRDLVPIQDEINKRRSKALHLITMRQSAIAKSAGLDPNKVRRELAKPDGVIEIEGGVDIDKAFKILDTNDMSAGNLALLQDAKNDMTVMGPNAAMQGKDPRQQSGRAIQAQQQGGMTELAPILDALRDWQQRCMRQAWNRVRQFWDEETWVRVTDDEEGLKFVGLNVPVTLGEKLEEGIKNGVEPPPELMQQIQMNPAMMEQVVGTRNDVGKLDVDIIIDEQPDVVTLQAETFETLAKAQAAGFPVPPDVMIEAGPFPHKVKRKMLEKMKEAEGQPPKVDPALQLKAEETKAKIEADKVKAAADIRLKEMEIEAQREQNSFERQRMQNDMALERLKMAHEMQKMAFERQKLTMQREMQRENASFTRQKGEIDIAARKSASQAN